MTRMMVTLGPANADDGVDDAIAGYLDPGAPRSYFLYAGAGTGKTRSLVNALKAVRHRHGSQLRKVGHKIAVITYTNAACDEIISRVDDDPLFAVSTIHSFCWREIGTFHADIQYWLTSSIPSEIAELEEQQAKGRAGTKAALDRERGIAIRKERLEWLSMPRRFTYNPNGDNFEKESLSHAEVLKITAHFIQTKPSMQEVLVNRYPFLLVDESQDTSKHLIDAFLALESAHRERFAIGLFGDTMQRIYADGKLDLGNDIPDQWAKPFKKMNHRCPQRIVQLGNALRAPVDGKIQLARDDSEQGLVRLFIAAADTPDKPATESLVRDYMADQTGDSAWNDAPGDVKTLTLEHHMAATRMGFIDLFRALDEDPKHATGLRDGSLAGLRLFLERIAPLIEATARNDNFAVMALLRKTSPLLKRTALLDRRDSLDPLAQVRAAVGAVLSINPSDSNTTFLEVLRYVARHGLFSIPDSLKPFSIAEDTEKEGSYEDEEEVEEEANNLPSSTSLHSWRTFLETPYRQIIPYADYVSDQGAFGTHQGVKGKEFDRVLVVIDDTEARGFMFSYEKLFGAKPMTTSDQKKRDQGEETGIDRTRRLFYVTCTRAKKSLGIMAYTNDPDRLETSVIDEGWFEASEIVRL